MRPSRLVTTWMVVLPLAGLSPPWSEARAQSAIAPPVWMPPPPPAGSQPTPTQPIPSLEPRPTPSQATPSNTPYLGWTPWIPMGWFPPYLMKGDLFGSGNNREILKPQIDARTVQVSVDPDNGTITSSLSAADVPLGPTRTETIDQYASRMLATGFRQEWVDQSLQRINQVPTEAASNTRPGFAIALPITLPKAARSFLGDAPPALNVSGSERLALSGTSNWTNQASAFGTKPSLFPQLDMQQDLNINVTGTLGDKVAVDVTQFSGVQSPLSNRIALRFSGDEDQVIQKLDLGNTNLSLPNTQYVSYSGRNDGLFGVM